MKMWTGVLLGSLVLMLVGMGIAIIGFGDYPAISRPMCWLSAVPLFIVLLWSETVGTVLRWRRFRRFAELNDDELYLKFYHVCGYPKKLVCSLRQDLASAFGVAAVKLHPEHKLVDGPFERPGIDVVSEIHESLAFAAAASKSRVGELPDLEHVDSVDGYIRAFCECYQRQLGVREHE
jgi:hypothetical protein